jgi:hypothetical protein
VLLDGAARATLWAGAPLAGTLTRGTAADTQAPVWLISPQNNDTVNASFDVHLAASVDGGNLVLRVREGSLIRSETSVTLGTGAPLRAEAHVPLTLPPGTYTLEAFTVSPATGRPQSMDNHTIIVR